ncbi:MAG: HAD hydrolase-like protein [Bacteroidales bacterium]|nr:HAD hydrolase-like protein [Bacteroidales bacterium]
MLKAVLFDMDGVLFDSMKNHAEAWYRVMGERYGFECDRDIFYMYEGSTGVQTIDAFFVKQKGRHATEEEWKQIYKEKSDCFTSLGLPMPMPGAAEVLENAYQMGLTRVLVTGSSQASLIGRLATSYPGVFDEPHIVSGFDCPKGHGKPHPDPYLIGLRKAAGNISPVNWNLENPFNDGTKTLHPSEAIVVENAPMGVEAAKAAGIFTIAVNTGPLDPKVLKDAGADIVLSGMVELADKIVSIASANW